VLAALKEYLLDAEDSGLEDADLEMSVTTGTGSNDEGIEEGDVGT